MTERIWINRVSREIVFNTVCEDQVHLESHQQDITDGMRSLWNSLLTLRTEPLRCEIHCRKCPMRSMSIGRHPCYGDTEVSLHRQSDRGCEVKGVHRHWPYVQTSTCTRTDCVTSSLLVPKTCSQFSRSVLIVFHHETLYMVAKTFYMVAERCWLVDTCVWSASTTSILRVSTTDSSRVSSTFTLISRMCSRSHSWSGSQLKQRDGSKFRKIRRERRDGSALGKIQPELAYGWKRGVRKIWKIGDEFIAETSSRYHNEKMRVNQEQQ